MQFAWWGVWQSAGFRLLPGPALGRGADGGRFRGAPDPARPSDAPKSAAGIAQQPRITIVGFYLELSGFGHGGNMPGPRSGSAGLGLGAPRVCPAERGGFLCAARLTAKRAETLEANPYRILGRGTWESRAYKRAVGAGDWSRADCIYLDRLEALAPGAYLGTLLMEGLARELDSALDERASRATTLYRWMDLVELESYLGGTFESRTVPGKGRRGCRLFSLWTNGYALERPVQMAVPVDDVVRGKLRTAVYTALPCPVSSAEERIDSRKHLAKANETECRLEDGTRVPGGTCIRVESHVLDARSAEVLRPA